MTKKSKKRFWTGDENKARKNKFSKINISTWQMMFDPYLEMFAKCFRRFKPVKKRIAMIKKSNK